MILFVVEVKFVPDPDGVWSDGPGEGNDGALLAELCWLTVVCREVQDAVENFIEKHPKGKITKKGFKEMYKELYPNKNCEKIMERMFKMYDKDNDGYIQFRELMMVIYVMSDGSVEDNLRQIFRV